MLTQRRINLGLMIFLTSAGYAQALILLSKSIPYALAFGSGGLIYTLLTLAYWRRWEPARHLAVLTVIGLVGVFLQEPFLATSQTMEVLLPPVVALILTGPVWVVGGGALMMGIIALRTGGQSTYLVIDNLVTYGIIVSGMVFSRLAVDNAQRLADANTRADQARAEAEQRAEELRQRNDSLHALLAENAAQRDAIRELSVPLLPVAHQTLVLPLVGALDSARLLLAQERTLATIYTYRAQALIIDVTGVPLIDTQVARGLIDLIGAVQLLGARVLLVGIRGEVAETIVDLRLDLRGLTVERDVQSALARLWGEMPLQLNESTSRKG